MSKKNYRTSTLWIAIALVSALVLSSSPAGAAKKDRLRFSLTAQGTGHVGLAAGRASRLTLTIKSWSTPEELAKMREIIAGDDVKQIRKALGKSREIGVLQVPGQPGIDIIYARRDEQDGKTYVSWVADQPWGSIPNITTDPQIRFLVAMSTMELDSEGKGTGVIAPAVQPAIDGDGRVTIEHSVHDPVNLTSVSLQK